MMNMVGHIKELVRTKTKVAPVTDFGFSDITTNNTTAAAHNILTMVTDRRFIALPNPWEMIKINVIFRKIF